MDEIPTRKGPMLLLIGVLAALIVLLVLGARLLSDSAAAPPVLGRLELSDERRETTIASAPAGRLTFWGVRVTEEGAIEERKVDLLRYEIELHAGGKLIVSLSCDPYRATEYLRESHDGARHEAEHDMDGCSASVPTSAPITVRARRVWLRQPEEARFLETELVIRSPRR